MTGMQLHCMARVNSIRTKLSTDNVTARSVQRCQRLQLVPGCLWCFLFIVRLWGVQLADRAVYGKLQIPGGNLNIDDK
jgi:hypothetical protein